MIKHFLTGLLTVSLAYGSLAQTTFPQNGVYDERPGLYAFTNATIVVDPQTTLQNATLLIRNGRIEAVGTNVSVPAGTVIADLKGKRIYPALIDIDSDYGMPEVTRGPGGGGRGAGAPQYESNKKGPYYWNQAIQPENEAGIIFKANAAKADELRKLGFGAVLVHPHDGIARGTGALVTLADDRENTLVLKPNATAHFSFSKGTSTQQYPNSMMGVVALLRQAMYDADWYKRAGSKEQANMSLDALNRIRSLPTIFEANDKLGIMRADKIGDEFGVQYIVRSTGDEYQMIDEVRKTGASLIVPLNFPQPYDVEDPWDADNVSLAELKHWEMAPSNAGRLAAANIPFAFTTAGLRNKTDFWPNLRKAIENGLPEQKALEALTTIPAKLIHAEDMLGSLQKGRVANFIITSGNLFSADNVIYESWTQGKQYIVTTKAPVDLRGSWALTIGDRSNLKLNITGKTPDKLDYQIVADTARITPKVAASGELISMQVQLNRRQPGTTRLTGYRTSPTEFKGDGEMPNGQIVQWSAVRTGDAPASTTATSTTATSSTSAMASTTATTPASSTATLLYPFVGMGNAQKPKAESVLIRNATVWTNEKDGVLSGADVLVTDGKISKVGKGLTAPAGVKEVDGTGKHLTNGIIDEHSHIALLSINEGGQSSSAEVRMSDVINPEDINIYRQLAGGVTASQLLHGSANSIGGQSALVKLKWGESPEGMLIKGADGFIKFALGENVKQSNYPNPNVLTRFPQSRMGVEQVYMDHFTRAKEYAKGWEVYNKLSAKEKATAMPPRRDIELDALAEILAAKRFITCHSYVQSEINMLLKVADSLGFKVNTFTHILEGYKLADKMAKHGVGGSSFADWWAYKMEVHDAIPYNAALMHRQGVVVSINSDDAEMARRLNQEAAKTVEYGGVSEEDAWKMVTLNPAKLLHLDTRLGSIRPGKDADLVLWNAHPLSIYARPEITMIEGATYFSLKDEDAKRDALHAERSRIIQKMLAAKASGASTVRPTFRRARMWHCEDIEGVMAEGEEEKAESK
ncbi:amidohydrolase family protein [Spirosoma panaciterrae]|uniref:amidohydrolase family protein n=1 Tax=Spirosoma panaciterrae TaxID=496058 RepID=UPI00037A73E2|nr:amidohydrolase family protein [Spirosoma panaciterrae]